jgi:hypothetical protein
VSVKFICVPLSNRNAIPMVWTSDVVYVNCYECKEKICNSVCIYTLIKDAERTLCPRKGKDGLACGGI